LGALRVGNINADIVEKALRASYLHPDMDLSETAIWKHERLGEMFQQKTLDQEEAGTDNSDKEGNADEEIEEESDLEDAICVLDED
jgi:hypothetical protein